MYSDGFEVGVRNRWNGPPIDGPVGAAIGAVGWETATAVKP